MAEKKLEQCKTGAAVGSVVGVGLAVIASPLMLLTGPRAAGEMFKGIIGGCMAAGMHVEKKLSE